MNSPLSAADDVRSLAALPLFVSASFGTRVQVRRCEADRIAEWTSQEFFERIRALSVGLRLLAVRPGDRVGIMCESRPEWSLADLAILSAQAITVPVYPTLSATQTAFILKDAGATLAVVSDGVQLAKMQAVAAELPDLRAILIVVPPAEMPPAVRPGLTILPMAHVLDLGAARLQANPALAAEYEHEARAVLPSDTATIIYTSGTTGEPKGVVLTHDNILSNVLATNAVLGVTPADHALSFLPLSHTFERTALYLYLASGATITFAESLQTIPRDLVRVRPTIMTGAPRVFEKFHSAILENIAGAPAMRQRLFRWALAVGLKVSADALAGRSLTLLAMIQVALAEALVWRKVRARVGGRTRAIVSGSAPLARTTAEFFHAMGMTIYEGYGLTESAPVITVNPLGRPRFGTVGQVIPGVEIRIAADGEILARGRNIMREYYNRPADTAAVLRDGWLCTGDIGEIDADGYLRITDRKKDLIVTSGGKNIAPQPIQQRLKASPLVSDAIIIGDRRNFPAALIVPDFAAVEAALQARGLSSGTREQLVERADVQALFQPLLDDINRDLAQFERIKRFALLPSEMTVEGGELTPTLKLRRPVVEQRFAGVIEQMYATREAAAG